MVHRCEILNNCVIIKEKAGDQMKVKRNYRDSLFRSIFNNKKNLLSLYNALEGTDYTDSREIRITTLRGTFFNDLKNDISFQIRNQYIVLLEH